MWPFNSQLRQQHARFFFCWAQLWTFYFFENDILTPSYSSQEFTIAWIFKYMLLLLRYTVITIVQKTGKLCENTTLKNMNSVFQRLFIFTFSNSNVFWKFNNNRKKVVISLLKISSKLFLYQNYLTLTLIRIALKKCLTVWLRVIYDIKAPNGKQRGLPLSAPFPLPHSYWLPGENIRLPASQNVQKHHHKQVEPHTFLIEKEPKTAFFI
jgi:hypothetical protein